jgi:DNA-binding response OmpR family regulator
MESPITVLIVDDNTELLGILADGLTMIGSFNVLTAQDGLQGLELCLAQRPDCMVIDVKMPEINGYQLVRLLRGDPQTAEIPLILLTALAQSYERSVGIGAGTDRYLVKPVTPRELAKVLREVVAISQHERQMRYQRFVEEQGEENHD